MGFATSTAIFATSLFVPPPIEIESDVSSRTALANAMRRALERLVVVQLLGAAHVEIPLVDARAFHYRRESLQHAADLRALSRARAARHGHAHCLRTELERLRGGHRGAHAELARLVRRRAHDAAALARSADDQERRLPRALGIDEARDRDVERVGVGEEDATGRSGHERKIEPLLGPNRAAAHGRSAYGASASRYAAKSCGGATTFSRVSMDLSCSAFTPALPRLWLFVST